ncbi:MAG: site-2 protease family protein [bacterium]
MGLLSIIENPILFITIIISLLVALSIHEFAHSWTANFLGDDTSKRMGRLTLNPAKHLDVYGSLSILLLGIGWGKPVQINPNNFNNPRMGNALTAIAGPVSNLLLALLLSSFYNFVPDGYFKFLLFYMILYNIFLLVFNLIPISPLDGQKFFALFFPILDNNKYVESGPIILIMLIVISSFTTFSVFSYLYSITILFLQFIHVFPTISFEFYRTMDLTMLNKFIW